MGLREPRDLLVGTHRRRRAADSRGSRAANGSRRYSSLPQTTVPRATAQRVLPLMRWPDHGLRERDRLDPVAGEDIPRGGLHTTAARRIVARDGEIGLTELPSAVSRGKSLMQASFAQSARRGSPPAPPLTASRNSSARRASQIAGASRAAAARRARSPPCRCARPGLRAVRHFVIPVARTTTRHSCHQSAREDERDVAAGRLHRRRHGQPAHLGRAAAAPRYPALSARNAASARTVSMIPDAASRWPNAHLNAVTGGPPRRRSPAARALPTRRPAECRCVRDDHSDIGGTKSRSSSRARSPARARRHRRGSAATLRLRRAALPRISQKQGTTLGRRASGLDDQRRRALAHRAAAAIDVERSQLSLGQQPDPW